jgi:uncharacterized surface protein with fasciclin (FAS1) repeats
MKTIAYSAAILSMIALSQPTSAANIVEVAKSAGTFNTLLAAAEAAGLVDALSGDGPLTVFAPTDDAFAALPAGTVENLLKPENKDQLVAVLSYHVVGQSITSDMIASGTSEVTTIKAAGDQTITVEKGDAGVTVDGAKVIQADIKADNGVVHVIDKVILPAN